MTEREKVFNALRQLEEHAPNWVETIRAYILKIEKQRGGRDRMNDAYVLPASATHGQR